MALLILKFGGTSVADIAAIERAADIVATEKNRGHEIIVVVSAMAGVTNRLISYCTRMHNIHDMAEYDTVIASGEQTTAALMAIALQKRNLNARSWLGWQIPIRCNNIHGKATITSIETSAIKNRLTQGEIAVCAGFQGICDDNRIVTLGRGGSDTTAVALAGAFGAERCDIYTDVDGIYTTDPRIAPAAQKLKCVTYEEMIELASVGAKVLQTHSVATAMSENVRVQVLSSMDGSVGSDLPGTLLMKEEDMTQDTSSTPVQGIAYSHDEAKITIRNVPDTPGVAAKVFEPLASNNIHVDMIVQNVANNGKATDMTFTVPESETDRAVNALKKTSILKDTEIIAEKNVAKLSVIGIGIRSNPQVALTLFETLAANDINIHVITTAEIRISILIDNAHIERAVSTLHSAYGLDKP